MALSASWGFTVNRDDVITEAMQNVGALGELEIPTAQEVTDCARKLNMLVKQWMGSQDFAPGLKMWERQRGELFLTSTQGVYELGPNTSDNWAGAVAGKNLSMPYNMTFLATEVQTGDNSLYATDVSGMNVGDNVGIFIGPDIFWTKITAIAHDSGNFQIPGPGLPAASGAGATVYSYTTKAQRPLSIVTCILRDQFGNDTPMNPITLQEYELLPSKSDPDFITDPYCYYYESQFASGTTNTAGGLLFLDMYGAQDTNKHLHIVYIRPVMDLTKPVDNPEYPQQWYRALCWGLTKEICPMFDAEFTPEMKSNYDEALAMAREADSETSAIYFQPNDDNDYGV